MKVAMVSGGGRGSAPRSPERLLEDGWTVSLGLRDPGRPTFGAPEIGCRGPFDATDPATAAPGSRRTLGALRPARRARQQRRHPADGGFRARHRGRPRRLWAVNVKAPFRLIRAALPHLRRTGAGRVINIASTDAKRYRAASPSATP
jgi:hypothetical protein